MSETLTETPSAADPHAPVDESVRREVEKAVENLVTEDDEPVDNIFSAKQQRLLVEPLYSSWTPLPDKESPDKPRPFIADANVGVFSSLYQPPLVPDMFLSLDVQLPERLYKKSSRSYFLWEYGKPPEVVVEIVSNKKGNELGSKLRDYARIGVAYYIVYDPMKQLSDEVLHIFELHRREYKPLASSELSDVGLGVALWASIYEGMEDTWLRWCDAEGNMILTGAERAGLEADRANREAERAKHEAEHAMRLAAKLREMGVDPDEI